MKTKHERSHVNRSWREMSESFKAVEKRIDDCIRDIGWDYSTDDDRLIDGDLPVDTLDMLEVLLRSIERPRWEKQAERIRLHISIVKGRIGRSE